MSEFIICPYCYNPLSQREYVKVVRCRDCKNFEPDGEPSEVYPNSYWCDKLTVYMPPNGFCSFGKRREP